MPILEPMVFSAKAMSAIARSGLGEEFEKN